MPLKTELLGSSPPEVSPPACKVAAEIRRPDLSAGRPGQPAWLPEWPRVGQTCRKNRDGSEVYCGWYDDMLKVSGMFTFSSDATGRIERFTRRAQSTATGGRA